MVVISVSPSINRCAVTRYGSKSKQVQLPCLVSGSRCGPPGERMLNSGKPLLQVHKPRAI